VDRAWFQFLKLDHDEPLSNFAVKSNLRRYVKATLAAAADGGSHAGGALPTPMSAGADTRPLFALLSIFSGTLLVEFVGLVSEF